MNTAANPDWDAVKAAYDEGLPLHEIVKRFGISKYQLMLQVDIEGWPLRYGQVDGRRVRRRKLYMLRRISNVIGHMLHNIESRSSQDQANVLYDARDILSLKHLTSLIEQVETIEQNIREGETLTTGDDNDRAERFREGLAKRLANLEPRAD